MQFETIVTLVSSLVSCGVTYGIMRTKIDRLEQDHNSLVSDLRQLAQTTDQKFVTISHFEAVVGPLKDSMKEIQRDIKQILVLLSNYSKHQDSDE